MSNTQRIAALVLIATFASTQVHAAVASPQQPSAFSPAPTMPAESQPTPEPSTWALLAVAVLAVGFALRKQSRERRPSESA